MIHTYMSGRKADFRKILMYFQRSIPCPSRIEPGVKYDLTLQLQKTSKIFRDGHTNMERSQKRKRKKKK